MMVSGKGRSVLYLGRRRFLGRQFRPLFSLTGYFCPVTKYFAVTYNFISPFLVEEEKNNHIIKQLTTRGGLTNENLTWLNNHYYYPCSGL